MEPQVTATLLAKMKRQAKQRAKADESSHSAHLEAVAREHGFPSWFDVLQARDNPPLEDVHLGTLEVDPVLAPDFDDTPNEERSEKDLQQWWMRPFALTRPDGSFHVRCLDGGAWDRSTSYGVAPNLGEARKLAVEKLEKWLEYMDTPIVLINGNDSISMTVDTLWPDVDKTELAVLASFEEVTAWKAQWELEKASDPQTAKSKLKIARAKKLESWGLGHRNKIKRWPF